MMNSTWNREPPPGFQGLHPDIPVTFYFRHLPHWRQDGATYFVTFRLADSLPQSKLDQLRELREQWGIENGIRWTDWQSVLQKSAPPKSISHEEWAKLAHKLMQQIDKWLDQGMGNCWLKQPQLSKIVIDSLHFFDGTRYELGCYIIMPNHVHAILRPLQPQVDPLEKILQSRKRQTARRNNIFLNRRGAIWQDESFDRIIRDEEHLYRCIQYIGRNPGYAGLSLQECPRWIRPSWKKLGWVFED